MEHQLFTLTILCLSGRCGFPPLPSIRREYHNSEFKARCLLNAYQSCTIVKSKNRKSGTVCVSRSSSTQVPQIHFHLLLRSHTKAATSNSEVAFGGVHFSSSLVATNSFVYLLTWLLPSPLAVPSPPPHSPLSSTLCSKTVSVFLQFSGWFVSFPCLQPFKVCRGMGVGSSLRCTQKARTSVHGSMQKNSHSITLTLKSTRMKI